MAGKYLIIDTYNKINSNTANIVYRLKTPITVKKFLKLAYCCIPMTETLINLNNNV